MSTEDDTFRVLSRPGIHEMYRLYIEWYAAQGHNYPTTMNIEFVRQYNWEWLEFLLAKNAAGYFY